jgi:hypothetical protein
MKSNSRFSDHDRGIEKARVEAGGLGHPAQGRPGEGGDSGALAAGDDGDPGVGRSAVTPGDEVVFGAFALLGSAESREEKARTID